MNINRIYAIILRNIYTFKHNYDRVFDAFYWPTIELLLWGITSSYFVQQAPGLSKLVAMIVSGLIFWMVVYRSQYETNISLLEDIWSKNLINIFISPLKFSEWIIAVLIIGIIKSFISFIFAAILVFVLYQVKIIIFSIYLIPFLFLLWMTAWTASFFIAGLIFRFGYKVQSFAWTLLSLITPFSGIYYPISFLPSWAQTISAILPTSYLFEGMREVINTGIVDSQKLVISFTLNIVYLILALIFLYRSYSKLLHRGLIQIQ